MPRRFVGVVMAHVMMMGANGHERSVGTVGQRERTAE